MLNNGDDQIDIKKLNRGKKFSKLYNFSKYDRRFFNKMKLWIKSEINLGCAGLYGLQKCMETHTSHDAMALLD